MRRFNAQVDFHTLQPTGQPSMRLSCPGACLPQPGQALLALRMHKRQPLRETLFPTSIDKEGFISPLVGESLWPVGETIDLLGPVGKGFSPPRAAQRWLLGCIGAPASRLLPLVDAGLGRGVGVSLWVAHPPPGLDPQVELTTDFAGALSWADYVALDVAPDGMSQLREVLGFGPDSSLATKTEVLLAWRMPCGVGVCGACGVKARRGWKLCCKEGPVFGLKGLDW